MATAPRYCVLPKWPKMAASTSPSNGMEILERIAGQAMLHIVWLSLFIVGLSCVVDAVKEDCLKT